MNTILGASVANSALVKLSWSKEDTMVIGFWPKGGDTIQRATGSNYRKVVNN
ncbi:MAG: hypothetical protein HOE73_00310 [Bacteroidetes Order II. Incertae sedis bacterium]|nr:hypothetical protein [Bacteroidetes Order II. bacterium]